MAGVVRLLWEQFHAGGGAPGSVHPARRAGNPLFTLPITRTVSAYFLISECQGWAFVRSRTKVS